MSGASRAGKVSRPAIAAEPNPPRRAAPAWRLGLMALVITSLNGCSWAPVISPSPRETLRKALTFYASFDHGPDADFALGDRQIYTATAVNARAAARPGLPAGTSLIARGQGRFGDALQFTRKSAGVVFFQGARNTAYDATHWSGTVSFWLSLDPAEDLEPGFCDPLQVGPGAWNDAAFFVEFEKRREIPFRLGVYADYPVWNPANRKWDEIPAVNRPLITIAHPPFARGKWTHVVFTFEHFNTGQPDGLARLYLDGEPAGSLPPRTQTFTWDERLASIMLGLGYLGLFDELAWFSRALSESEVRSLHGLEHGVASLLAP